MGITFNPFSGNLDFTGGAIPGTVTEDGVQTLTNKTIDADDNTILNIDNDEIKANAGIDANKIADGSVSNTEYQYINSLTSNAQDQLDDKIDDSEKGSPNGVATLDGGGKIPVTQLPSSIMEYKGVWDASTNTPILADGIGDTGDVYRVSVAGTQDLGSGPISFEVGDYVIYNGTIWEKSDTTDAVASVNGLTGIVVLTTTNINEGSNLYFTDERAQDAVGTILTDSSSINFTYNDGTPSIVADVIPGGVDHNSLLNYVANQHVDHTTVQIATGANSGLTGGGTIAATRNLSVDIPGTTAETSIVDADQVLIYDDSATALRSMTRGNFTSGLARTSTGDIAQTTFSGAQSASNTNITGFAFANATVRSFKAQVSVAIDATTDLNETFELTGVQLAADWDLSYTGNGDNTSVIFNITSAGQVQYSSSTYSGFSSMSIRFRALTTGV